MKKLLRFTAAAAAALASSALLLQLLLPGSLQAAGYSLTSTILQGKAWVFSQIETFNAGLVVGSSTMQVKKDYTLSTPAQAPTSPTTTANAGNCVTGRQYRFYYLWANAGGVSALGPATTDFTASTTNKTTQVTLSETPPAGATMWLPVYSQSTDGHSTKRSCSGIGVLSDPLVGTTTFECQCSSLAVNITSLTASGNKNAIAMTPGADISAAQASTSAALPIGFLTEDKNRLRLTGPSPLWSNDSGATYGIMSVLGASNIVTLCKSGCQASTFSGALSLVTGNTATNRWAILVSPGVYVENVIANKSYVSLVGLTGNPLDVHIQPATTPTHTVEVQTSITETAYLNLWVSGGYSLGTQLAGSESGGATVYVNNCLLGSIGDAGNLLSFSGFDEGGGGAGGHKIYITNSTIRGEVSALNSAIDSDYFLRDNLYDVDCTLTNGQACNGICGISGNGVRLDDLGSKLRMLDGGTIALGMTALSGATASGSRSGSMRFAGTIEMNATNASHTQAMTAVSLGSTVAGGGFLDVSGTTANVTSAGNAESLTGISITADTDHSSWTAAWMGGAIRLSGGATRNDVTNAETASGFRFDFADVVNGGVFTGAGVSCPGANCTTFASSYQTQQLLPADADLVANTCKVGEIRSDNGGATRELCWCFNNGGSGRWACVSATSANGPTD